MLVVNGWDRCCSSVWVLLLVLIGCGRLVVVSMMLLCWFSVVVRVVLLLCGLEKMMLNMMMWVLVLCR